MLVRVLVAFQIQKKFFEFETLQAPVQAPAPKVMVVIEATVNRAGACMVFLGRNANPAGACYNYLQFCMEIIASVRIL